MNAWEINDVLRISRARGAATGGTRAVRFGSRLREATRRSCLVCVWSTTGLSRDVEGAMGGEREVRVRERDD